MRVCAHSIFQPHFDTFFCFLCPGQRRSGNKFYNKIYYVYFAWCPNIPDFGLAAHLPVTWYIFYGIFSSVNFWCPGQSPVFIPLLSQRIWVHCKNHLLNVYPSELMVKAPGPSWITGYIPSYIFAGQKAHPPDKDKALWSRANAVELSNNWYWLINEWEIWFLNGIIGGENNTGVEWNLHIGKCCGKDLHTIKRWVLSGLLKRQKKCIKNTFVLNFKISIDQLFT